MDGKKLLVSREVEGGNKEVNEIDLPCVLSIQTGINEPRYVGMRGIRQVASLEIPTFSASDLGVDKASIGRSAAKVQRTDYFVPALGKGAEILAGSRDEIIDTMIDLVKAKGGLR
jgi:electron transfer flavoprotein beta subunit